MNKEYVFKEPRGYKIEDMLYEDRCMMKWQGFLLSDHNERMEEEKIDEVKTDLSRDEREKDYEIWNTLMVKSLKEKQMIRVSYIDEVNQEKTISVVLVKYSRNSFYFKCEKTILRIEKKRIINVESL